MEACSAIILEASNAWPPPGGQEALPSARPGGWQRTSPSCRSRCGKRLITRKVPSAALLWRLVRLGSGSPAREGHCDAARALEAVRPLRRRHRSARRRVPQVTNFGSGTAAPRRDGERSSWTWRSPTRRKAADLAAVFSLIWATPNIRCQTANIRSRATASFQVAGGRKAADLAAA